MKTIRTIIVDDERLAREELKSLLKDILQIEIIDEAKNGEEALEKINALSPDLVFMDINMPGLNGFEVLNSIDCNPQIIFITAYDEYALKAFEVKAIDYILKPIDPVRLNESLHKILLEEDFEANDTQSLTRKNKTLKGQDRIFLKDGEKCVFITLNEVKYFESEGNYVKVYFNDSKLMILKTLNALETVLDQEQFFRVNRKHIVNLNYVSKVENWFNGGLQLELMNGEKIEISRRQAIRFKDLFSL